MIGATTEMVATATDQLTISLHKLRFKSSKSSSLLVFTLNSYLEVTTVFVDTTGGPDVVCDLHT